MGRDVTGSRIDKKSNMVNDSSNDGSNCAVHVAPIALLESAQKNEEQDVLLGVKSVSNEPEAKDIKAEAHKSTDRLLAKPEFVSANNWEIEKQVSCANHANGVEDNGSSSDKVLSKFKDFDSPKSENKLLSNTHLMSMKQLQPNHKNYYDEEDNWSLASFTATSVRSKITVPIAPRFSCVDRLERRREFYTKLEEKHKALEKEKLEYKARTNEEEQAVTKQLRKNMVVKANPVPSFYREGPPPKVKLNKLPVTRAKSPNLTRRKSCGDRAVRSSPEDKGFCGRAARHSVGLVHKEGKPTSIQKNPSPITPPINNTRKVKWI